MAREIEFAFPLPGGLHARPASLLRDAVSRFRSGAVLTNRRSGRSANAKSTLALVSTLTRGADPCLLRLEGEDEPAAAEELRRFLREELPFCEEEAPLSPPPAEGGRALPRALAAAGAHAFRGVPASGGISRARAFLLDPWRGFRGLAGREGGPAAAELLRLDRAFARARAELEEGLRGAGNETVRAIVAAHLSILDDTEFRARIEEDLAPGGLSAGSAVVAAAGHFSGLLRESGSAILEERALDVRDIAARLIRALNGGYPEEVAAPSGDFICLSESITPSQFLSLAKGALRGIALSSGGRTSHTAILARTYGIPCVTGASGVDLAVSDGQEVIVDGERGLVVPDPPPGAVRFYEFEREKLEALRRRAEGSRGGPALTADGKRVELTANVSSAEEARLAFQGVAEGIGLFRTEFLFMNRPSPPSEDEQARLYSEAVRQAAGRPVVLRTLDAGGDKAIPYLRLPSERNPALGFRGIRIYGERRELLAAQIRACLRASAAGTVRIMFPMVATPGEARAARELVDDLKAALAREGIAHDPRAEVGIMLEVPSAAFLADQLAREADFFSIGTNDLSQYFFAADRENAKVGHLCDPLHPAFLRLLKKIVQEGHAQSRRVSLCGELGGDALALPLLVGLGLDGISMASPRLAETKAALARCDTGKCRALLETCLARGNGAEVRDLLRGFLEERRDRPLVSIETVRLSSRSRTREEAIRELVDLLHLAGRVSDPDGVEEAVWRREEVSSTGVGFGVALPHAKAPGILASSISFLRLEPRVGWGSGDEEPVGLAILIAVQADAPGDEHLKRIAALSRRLMDDTFREALRAAAEPETIVALLKEAAG